jgi:hypothetical protein
MVRRIVQVKRPDAAIKDFFDRCEKRGVDKEFIKKLDVAQTKAVRSIGNGSHANRLVSLRELQGISGQFDDVGRRNLTRDIVSTRVGHDLADRYVPAQEDDRQTVDTKIAYFENQQLQQGQPVPVVSSEMHGQHLQLHVPLLQQFIQAINEGQADPQQVLPALQALYQHIGETAQYAAGDPALGAVVSNAKQILQYAEEAINNTTKALEKIQREQQQISEEGGGGQPQMSEVDMKLQKAQVDMQITQQKAELDMAIKQKKFDQEQAIRDAEAALRFREQE